MRGATTYRHPRHCDAAAILVAAVLVTAISRACRGRRERASSGLSASAGGQANRIVIDWRDPKYHPLLIPPHELAAAHGRAVPADAHGADGRRARAPRSPLGVAVQHARAAHLDALHDARAHAPRRAAAAAVRVRIRACVRACVRALFVSGE